MNENLRSVLLAISREDEAVEICLKGGLLTVVRDALMFDAQPPQKPSADGLPEAIQAAIAVGAQVHKVVCRNLDPAATHAAKNRIPWAPLALLAGALLRSQGLELDYEQLRQQRVDCQLLNVFLEGDS
jgi:hypothetical protein